MGWRIFRIILGLFFFSAGLMALWNDFIFGNFLSGNSESVIGNLLSLPTMFIISYLFLRNQISYKSFPLIPAGFVKMLGNRSKSFDVFELPDGALRAVKHGFSWPSFFFSWIWCIFYAKLYGWGIGLLAVLIMYGFFDNRLERASVSAPSLVLLSLLLSLGLLGFVIYFSYNANNFRRRNYIRLGYPVLETKLQSENAAEAIYIFRNSVKTQENSDVTVPVVDGASNTKQAEDNIGPQTQQHTEEGNSEKTSIASDMGIGETAKPLAQNMTNLRSNYVASEHLESPPENTVEEQKKFKIIGFIDSNKNRRAIAVIAFILIIPAVIFYYSGSTTNEVDCGESKVGVWSYGPETNSTYCAGVEDGDGNTFIIVKQDHRHFMELQGLKPMTNHSIKLTTNIKNLFTFQGITDDEGGIHVRLKPMEAGQIIERLRKDRELVLLISRNGHRVKPIKFGLNGSYNALSGF